MAEQQKNIDLPVAETALTTAPATSTTDAVILPAAVEPAAPAAENTTTAVDDTPAEQTKTTEVAAEVVEDVKPIEEGHLGHKAQGLSFPKNLIPTKEFFFFGTDAFEPKSLSTYQKTEKLPTTAQSNIAWASETGRGLLFSGDKKAPTGIINLSDATEPETDGTHKFTLTSKGNKHSFKAATTAERDNWVSQLKLKIAEAQELAASVTESETYMATIESFKPVVPVKKEEKVVEAPKEEIVASEEAPETTAVAEDKPTEETKADSPKPLKAKRASFFGFINKKDEPKEEAKIEDVKADETPVVAPVEETPKVEESAAPVVATETTGSVVDDKTADETKLVESPKEKPSNTKRNSFFGSVFSKKDKKPDTKAVESTETSKDVENTTPSAVETSENAPVIPPVETTTPLAVEVSNPATAPTETVEVPAATNGEVKKDTKEKRKSSLPFVFGKREKSPSPVEGEDKSPKSAFSKLRATIKGKTAPKAEDKTIEEAAKTNEVIEPKADDAAVTPVEEPVRAAETETKPETVATSTPAVTATA